MCVCKTADGREPNGRNKHNQATGRRGRSHGRRTSQGGALGLCGRRLLRRDGHDLQARLRRGLHLSAGGGEPGVVRLPLLRPRHARGSRARAPLAARGLEARPQAHGPGSPHLSHLNPLLLRHECAARPGGAHTPLPVHVAGARVADRHDAPAAEAPPSSLRPGHRLRDGVRERRLQDRHHRVRPRGPALRAGGGRVLLPLCHPLRQGRGPLLVRAARRHRVRGLRDHVTHGVPGLRRLGRPRPGHPALCRHRRLLRHALPGPALRHGLSAPARGPLHCHGRRGTPRRPAHRHDRPRRAAQRRRVAGRRHHPRRRMPGTSWPGPGRPAW